MDQQWPPALGAAAAGDAAGFAAGEGGGSGLAAGAAGLASAAAGLAVGEAAGADGEHALTNTARTSRQRQHTGHVSRTCLTYLPSKTSTEIQDLYWAELYGLRPARCQEQEAPSPHGRGLG